MTARDYKLYHAKLASLEGRPCFLSMACNSIKLHIDRDEKNGTYLWIDPPWVFGTEDAEIETSETCPNHREPDYEMKFKQWGQNFTPMFENTILRIEATQRGRLLVFFGSGHVLCAPAIRVPKQEGCYDHWYAENKGELPEKQD